MLRRNEDYYEAMKVYQDQPFNPEALPPGTGWRIVAMREWIGQNRVGLAPIVSDKAPIIDGHCLSCGISLDKFEDFREPGLKLHSLNVCNYCQAARDTCSLEAWNTYNQIEA